MELRIDVTPEGSETVVAVAGHLSAISGAQFTEACDPLEGAVMIDLSGLLYADEKGISLIRTAVDKGAEVRGASQFIQLLLDNAS